MRRMAAGKFKAHCLSVMEDVRKKRETVVITKRGKPVAKLVPVEEDNQEEFLGRLQGIVKIVGDIESPMEPSDAWEMLR